MKSLRDFLALCCLLLVTPNLVCAAEAGEPHPVAIMDFAQKGALHNGLGEKVAAVIFASLVLEESLSLVERNELQKIEDEAVLNLSGMVDMAQANQIGMLTGARIIVTGTVFEVEDEWMLVAKIIGTETGRVLGASTKGAAGAGVTELAEQLAVKIKEVLTTKTSMLVAKRADQQDRLLVLKGQLGEGRLPSLTIDISERHINRSATDPAAENEMVLYGTELGFEVIDKGAERAGSARVLITGQGFSELATRKGELVGVKARLEVKAIDQRTKQILAVDRQTEMELDLSEISAAKKALSRASAKIAERMLPKLVIR
jgi:TolB-like protein